MKRSLLILFTLAWAASCGSRPPAAPDADLIRDVERQRLRALVDADVESARLLHADDFQLINPVGVPSSKEQYLGAVASGELDYQTWEPGQIDVRVYGGAAVIRYRSQLRVSVGGRDLGLRPHWHTDLYERRGGRWQVVWSQATVEQ